MFGLESTLTRKVLDSRAEDEKTSDSFSSQLHGNRSLER